jgi:hypothetical protein
MSDRMSSARSSALSSRISRSMSFTAFAMSSTVCWCLESNSADYLTANHQQAAPVRRWLFVTPIGHDPLGRCQDPNAPGTYRKKNPAAR